MIELDENDWMRHPEIVEGAPAVVQTKTLILASAVRGKHDSSPNLAVQLILQRVLSKRKEGIVGFDIIQKDAANEALCTPLTTVAVQEKVPLMKSVLSLATVRDVAEAGSLNSLLIVPTEALAK